MSGPQGNPSEENQSPAMTDPLPWRVFCLNDCEWWVARSLDEAKQDAAHQWGYSVEQAEREDLFDEPYELTDAQLDSLKFIEDRELPREQWVRRTFREELAHRISNGLSAPELFACTEY